MSQSERERAAVDLINSVIRRDPTWKTEGLAALAVLTAALEAHRGLCAYLFPVVEGQLATRSFEQQVGSHHEACGRCSTRIGAPCAELDRLCDLVEMSAGQYEADLAKWEISDRRRALLRVATPEEDIINQGTAEAVRQMRKQASTWPEHDCYAWNSTHFRNQPDATMKLCGTCGRITGFRWRSLRRRLASFFLGTAVDPR